MLHRAYGLTIDAGLELPELPLLQEKNCDSSDITIRAATGIEIPKAEAAEYVELSEPASLLYLAHKGRFRVSNGNLIEYDIHEGLNPKGLRLFLLGPALSLILHQRGNLVLHASCICISRDEDNEDNPVAVAFLGDSGEGKSTMAATMYERGHRAVSDDIVPVPDAEPGQEQNQPPLVPPGFPMFKLWPPSVEALYPNGETAALLPPQIENYPRWEKPAEREFTAEPVPLAALFVLQSGPELRCDQLAPNAALMALVRNSYWIAELPPHQRELHFQQCLALVNRVQIFTLQRPRELAQLGEVAALVESVVSTLPSEANAAIGT